ncbi:hypothetical protein AVL62_10005 [Serinicoccus chungangensis]|uniref:Helicase HerA central domain-containing protein n=1 Tax=Serinicoccus chungangensis TaxID=767452 RepID=A0A0W8I1M1_9MICO|nr:DUF87 domain-containing protein [Serinicoccus chungangensis]KUG51632.1 hypothetical protein AVL62_10005 [Serinicoccus chungangensis]
MASGTLVSVDGPPPAPVPTPVEVSRASDEEVGAVVSGPDRRLHVGRLQSMPEVPLGLVARKLNRHTFWCGQSGSGKTYALGVVLERILTATDLPVLVLDPNSDFVHLHTTVPTADPVESRELADRDVQVLRPDSDEHPLLIVVDEAHNLCPPQAETRSAPRSATVWSRSPPRVASTASGCWSPPNDRPRCTRGSSRSATT